ncbi:MAG: hypothetical protein V4635_05440 [Bacteroidota bacterium]
MRFIIFVAFSASALFCFSQANEPAVTQGSEFLKELKAGDSVIYYQCHVEEGIQQLSTASGQTLTGKPQKYTITEKYVLKKKEGNYSVQYFSSSLTLFPNRRFSGLKIREKAYWEFKEEKTFDLSNQDLKVLVSLENKGREATEYDYPVTKYTTNQLIIKSGKNFKQLVIDGNYVLSKLVVK